MPATVDNGLIEQSGGLLRMSGPGELPARRHVVTGRSHPALRAILSLSVLTFAIGVAGPARAAPPELATTTCAACHGADGNSTDPQYPKLAGQKPAYLWLQLDAFRNGARPSSVMKSFAHNLTDVQIRDLSRYYGAQREAPENGPAAADARRGAAVFRSGTVGVSCAACHASGGFGGGMMGGGMMMRTDPAVTPTLFAQHATYLEQQLDAFASGARPSTVMGPIARYLSPADRKAVADYLASVR